MSGFTVHFVDGGYAEFPSGGGQVDEVLAWFRGAEDGYILSLHTDNGVVCHAQKRNISRIVVTP